MTVESATVFIVDDDPSVREAISSLLRSVRLRVVEFESARDFLDHPRPPANSCLILDVRMPGISGLDLQLELAGSEAPIPIVFITGHGDIPMAVRAMKAGAIEFLPKPFRDDDLLAAVSNALRRDEAARHEQRALDTIRARYATFTERERAALMPIVKGALNKQVGTALGVSEQTVKVHRHNIMRKMGAESITGDERHAASETEAHAVADQFLSTSSMIPFEDRHLVSVSAVCCGVVPLTWLRPLCLAW